MKPELHNVRIYLFGIMGAQLIGPSPLHVHCPTQKHTYNGVFLILSIRGDVE